MNAPERRRAVIVAGHRGDASAAREALADGDESVRVAALGALERSEALTDDDLIAALDDVAPRVRHRAVELAATRPDVGLLRLLDDADPTVVEVAAWACGEQLEGTDDPDQAIIGRLAALAVGAEAPLVREASAAALGAIGHPAGLPAILHACGDKPHIRRRAVLALAPFEGAEVDAALERALTDRDWQVRQAAEDITNTSAQP